MTYKENFEKLQLIRIAKKIVTDIFLSKYLIKNL